MIEFVPFFIIFWLIGYAQGTRSKYNSSIKLIPEEDLIREVKFRRVKKRIEQEVESNLNKEIANG